MKVNELLNLWVCFHKEENFNVLVCACDENEAEDVIKGYCKDTGMTPNFEIKRFENLDTDLDCNHVLFKN